MFKQSIVSIIAGTLAFSAFASENNKDWDFKVSAFTTNKNIPDEPKNLNIGYKLTAGYNFNNNFYGKVTGIMYDRDHYAFNPQAGIKFDLMKHISPYADVGGMFYLNRGMENRYVNYDFGVKFDIYKGIYISGEVDQFFEKKYAAYNVEFGFPLSKNVVFSASYNQRLKGHYNGVSAGIAYLV
jgi:hypothetical protein